MFFIYSPSGADYAEKKGEYMGERVVVVGCSVVGIHEMQGDIHHHFYLDRFGNHTGVSSMRVKGMTNKSVNHGPGKATREFRPSAKKIERGRTGIDKMVLD